MEPTSPNTCTVCGASFDSEDEFRIHEAEHVALMEALDILMHLHVHLDIGQRLLEGSKLIEAQEWLGKAQGDVRRLAPFIGLNLESDQ
jgi:hypothetical protein